MTDKISPEKLKEKIFSRESSPEKKESALKIMRRLYPNLYDQINSQPIQEPTEPPVEPQTPKVNNVKNKLTQVYAFRLPAHQIKWLDQKFGKNKSIFLRGLIEREVAKNAV